MNSARRFTTWLAVSVLLLSGSSVTAEEIRVAVASNFSETLKDIATRFETQTGHRVILIQGATGRHYAQIKNGAPFDLFFAADVWRPKLLDEQNVALPGSRFTYAIGRIVLWSPEPGYIDAEGRVLERGGFRHLAIANPKLAPYGRAAREVLQSYGLWDRYRTRMVRGENIGQAFHYVSSGNAELGLVAYSQVKRPGQPVAGSLWVVPQDRYAPIEQQAVLLRDNDTARSFLSFIKDKESRQIIREFGYGVPDAG